MSDRRVESLLQGVEVDRTRIFSAPWEARAFALALGLSESGLFSWDEFRTRLIEEIGAADLVRERDGTTNHGEYYQYFLRALERVVTEKAIANPTEIADKLRALES